jgi:hypothetical protein
MGMSVLKVILKILVIVLFQLLTALIFRSVVTTHAITCVKTNK